MGFFWFIIAVTFLGLWLNEKSNTKTKTTKAYDDGYASGYWEFRKHIDKLVAAGKLTKTHRRDLVGAENLKEFGPEERDVSDEFVDEQLEDTGVIFQTEAKRSRASEITIQQVVVSPPQSKAPQPELSAEDVAAEKARRTLQNLNAMLYVGSFLIVAAAALLVTLTMPAAVKLAGIIAITVAFYTAGLVLHTTSERLRPAVIAFVGTGLAILPFVGFALHSLAGMSGQGAWLAISLVGLLAYGVAAVRLQSQLVSYLTIAFVLSLALSAVATVGLVIVWYFIATIGIATAFGALHFLRPRLVPAIFAQPVEQTSYVATPVALIASFFTFQYMNITMYEVLYGVATAHYLLAWLQYRRMMYETIVRVLLHVTLLIVAYDIVGGYQSLDERLWMNLAWVGVAVGQVVYSLARSVRGTRAVEGSWIGVMVGCIAVSLPTWLLFEQWAWGVSLSLALVVAISLATMWAFRQAAWAYGALASSIPLAFVVFRWAVEPPVSYDGIAVLFAMLAAVALVATERVKSLGRSAATFTLLAITTVTYVLCMLLAGVLHGESLTLGWTALLASAIFVMLSYIQRLVSLEVVGAGLAVLSVNAWVNWVSMPVDWRWLATTVLSSALLLGVAYIHHEFAERARRNALAITGAGVFGLVVLSQYSSAYPVSETTTALLVAAGFVALAIRIKLRARDTVLSKIGLTTYVTYPILAVVAAFAAGEGWLTLALATVTAMAWVGSTLERQPVLLGVGNIVFVCMLNTLWSWLAFDESWRLYGVIWIAATVNYIAYWYYLGHEDKERLQISLVSVLLLLGVGGTVHLFGTSTWGLAAAGSLLAAAGALAMHGSIYKRSDIIEISVYLATFALQRITELLIPDVNMVFYAHWWAVVIAIMGVKRSDYKQRMMVALALVTGSTGLFALAGESGYTVLFLIEHLVLLVVGALLRVQWAMWWGIVAVVVAILYFLRDYTALALMFLGFVIILIVIWRLLAVGKKK
ncbi:MAG: hypothetical protein WBP22_06195 [Candidatus Saccharimonas sp.]